MNKTVEIIETALFKIWFPFNIIKLIINNICIILIISNEMIFSKFKYQQITSFFIKKINNS